MTLLSFKFHDEKKRRGSSFLNRARGNVRDEIIALILSSI